MGRYLLPVSVVLSALCGVALAAAVVIPGQEFCPAPSSRSVSALFAPCQTFDTAMGHSVTEAEAIHMGLAKPDGEPVEPAPVTVPPQSPTPSAVAAREHATVG